MPRYAKQRDSYSCGPTALINIIKWSGRPISYRAARRIWIRNCATTKDKGTPPFFINRTLAEHLPSYGVSYRLCLNTRQGILSHARQGGAILVRFDWPNHPWGHVFLIVGATQHYLYVVNLFDDGPALQRIHRKTLMRCLSIQTSIWCWFLTR